MFDVASADTLVEWRLIGRPVQQTSQRSRQSLGTPHSAQRRLRIIIQKISARSFVSAHKSPRKIVDVADSEVEPFCSDRRNQVSGIAGKKESLITHGLI